MRSYVNSTDPYQDHQRKWRYFDMNISKISSEIENNQIKYYSDVSRNSEIKYYFSRNSKESYFFILPKDYGIFNINEILNPNPIEKINFPVAPDLNQVSSKELQDKIDYYKKIGLNTIDISTHLIQHDWKVVAEKVLGKKFDKIIDKDKFYLIENTLILEKSIKIKNELDNIYKKFEEIYNELKKEFDRLKKKIHNKSISHEENCYLIKLSDQKHDLPPFLRSDKKIIIDNDSKTLVIQFEFPDYSSISIKESAFKDKLISPLNKKKFTKQCLCSLIIRIGHLASQLNFRNFYENIVINVEQNWFDPATGKPKNGIIASLLAPSEYFKNLNLSKLNPETSFKYLKGILTPSFDNLSPIKPIFFLNKNDDRLVANKNIDQELEPEANLAAMEWEDFEHLVAQLFEWEFAKDGMEIKVTRASRDRGVDAIVFDPDPLKGGKYVLQAKRYTRTVDVSAVRDLYGTVMNEGANRGILITTASYGPDAYNFAKDKPISLVDGPNLLRMLQKHGKKFKIDLEEARILNNLK
jgi:restriction system protein